MYLYDRFCKKAAVVMFNCGVAAKNIALEKKWIFAEIDYEQQSTKLITIRLQL